MTTDKIDAFLALIRELKAVFDGLVEPVAPSGAGRMKGTLRNAEATLVAMREALTKREPNAKDVADILWLRNGFVAVGDDKWVTDQLASASLSVPDQSVYEAAGLETPAQPQTLAIVLQTLAQGLEALAT